MSRTQEIIPQDRQLGEAVFHGFGFSEVGYVFGRRIHGELGVPIGLIQMNCGGSTAKDWTPTPGVAESLTYDEPMQGLTHKPGVLYEVRMRGLVPYTARGVVWYQGEDDGGNPHPTGKQKIAERLARIALDRTYGKAQGVLFGPMYDSDRIEGDKILVKFKHTGSGLKTNDGAAPNWFEISDGTKDRNQTVYVRAEAKIIGPDTVAVRAEAVSEPKQARFGWHPLARFNLINNEGLPAVSFRTDGDPR